SNQKTRTEDTYRQVYTPQQRLELEKEYHYQRFIGSKRKKELSLLLQLTERQIKIWFQNRRAKDRRQAKLHQQQLEAGAAMISGSASSVSGSNAAAAPPQSHGLAIRQRSSGGRDAAS
uniref:Homeobox domain-containing protein n=1 Tax=Macrostomum lignano TaxID=282301 RepID=A0A1I8JPZ0_9PLAT